jgi:hypothetical protein
MSLNVSALSTYIDQERLPIIRKFLLEGRTQRYSTIIPDVKSTASINLMTTTLQLQPASACGWTNSGSTVLSQINASVCPIAYRESICLETLEQYFTQVSMNPGSYNTQIPFEEVFVNDKVANISQAIDNLLWQGQVGTAGNNGLCNGLIYKATYVYSGSVVNGNTGALTAITSSNIIAAVDNAVNVIPSGIVNDDELYCYVGYDFFRTYVLALRNANLYNYPSIENGNRDFEITIPASSCRMVAVVGLNGTNKFFITSKKNLYMFTDLTSDYEQFELWYSKDFNECRTNCRFKIGIDAPFWDQVVFFKL